MDTNELRKLADKVENSSLDKDLSEALNALRQAATEIDRLSALVHAGRKAGGKIRELQLEVARLRGKLAYQRP